MKEIIFIDNKNEIPKDYSYDTETDDFWVYRHKYTGDEIHITKEPPLYVNAIPIPDNATNGDMIRAIFPNITIFDENPVKTVWGRSESETKWWNSPYKVDKESN